MPQLFTLANSPRGNLPNYGNCVNYNLSTASIGVQIWVDPSAGKICKAIVSDPLRDTRTFTFTNVVARNLTQNDFNFDLPSSCPCYKPIDIVLVLDRSGSISRLEFSDERYFVKNFTQQFTYSTKNTELAVVQFSTYAWPVTLGFLNGYSAQNVNSTVNSLACCMNPTQPLTDPAQNTCCDGWTSISSGIRLAADQFSVISRYSRKVQFFFLRNTKKNQLGYCSVNGRLSQHYL